MRSSEDDSASTGTYQELLGARRLVPRTEGSRTPSSELSQLVFRADANAGQPSKSPSLAAAKVQAGHQICCQRGAFDLTRNFFLSPFRGHAGCTALT